MSPFLMALLGQQAAPDAVPADNEILVTADKSNKASAEDNPNLGTRLLGNTNAIEATQQAVQKGQEASDRRGLFGVKGTLRDVLGLVGDAFLVQGGKDPYYAPRRRQEQISDAWAGATEDPRGAAERVGYYDPKLGQEILSDYETSLLKKAQQDSLDASRQSTIDDKRLKQLSAARTIAQSLLVKDAAYNPDGSFTPDAEKALDLLSRQYNVTREELVGDLTGGAARLFGEAAINPYNQQRLQDADQNIAIAGRNADSRAISARASAQRAARPPAGRAPPNPTEASEFARIRAAVNRGEKLSPGDAKTWEKYTAPSSSGRRRPRSSGTGPSVSNW